MKWQYEQSLSKKAATIDNLKHEFNKLLINFNNIEDASRLREVMDDTSLGMCIHIFFTNNKKLVEPNHTLIFDNLFLSTGGF